MDEDPGDIDKSMTSDEPSDLSFDDMDMLNDSFSNLSIDGKLVL